MAAVRPWEMWWPPAVGDKLRDLRGIGFNPEAKGDLFHVVATFRDEGRTLAVIKHWMHRKRRWSYEVIKETAAIADLYRPDGMQHKPERSRS